MDKPTIRELTSRARESIIVFTDNDISQKRFGSTPVKLTATETLLRAANDKVDRFINNKTITEIKSDIEKAISAISNQNELAKQAEIKAINFAIEKITSHNAGFTHKELVTEALSFALKEQASFKSKVVTHASVMKVITEKCNTGELVMGKYFDDGTRWTTQKILDLERSIIKEVKKDKIS